jgi:hypothetical protein
MSGHDILTGRDIHMRTKHKRLFTKGRRRLKLKLHYHATHHAPRTQRSDTLILIAEVMAVLGDVIRTIWHRRIGDRGTEYDEFLWFDRVVCTVCLNREE